MPKVINIDEFYFANSDFQDVYGCFVINSFDFSLF